MRHHNGSQSSSPKWKQTLSFITRLLKPGGPHRNECTPSPQRQELMKLGTHLLRDLGFDARGCPIKPAGPEKTGVGCAGVGCNPENG